MMVKLKNSDIEIKFDECAFQTLVIENKQLFRRVSFAFYDDTPEDYFVFSLKYTPFEFHKKGMYIPSAVNLDMDNKKLITKINSFLERLANDELYTDLLEIKGKLLSFAEKLTEKSDFCVEYNCDIGAKEIIKLLSFEITRGNMGITEAFVQYVLLLSRYLGVELFVVSDLHLFFDVTELDLMFKTMQLNGVKMLCVEGFSPAEPSEYEKIHIIDRDLCEIE